MQCAQEDRWCNAFKVHLIAILNGICDRKRWHWANAQPNRLEGNNMQQLIDLLKVVTSFNLEGNSNNAHRKLHHYFYGSALPLAHNSLQPRRYNSRQIALGCVCVRIFFLHQRSLHLNKTKNENRTKRKNGRHWFIDFGWLDKLLMVVAVAFGQIIIKQNARINC